VKVDELVVRIVVAAYDIDGFFPSISSFFSKITDEIFHFSLRGVPDSRLDCSPEKVFRRKVVEEAMQRGSSTFSARYLSLRSF
jgi:hypothetical protein